MKRLQLLAAAAVLYCLSGLYTIYTDIRRLFTPVSFTRGSFGSGSFGNRPGFGGSSGSGTFQPGTFSRYGHHAFSLGTYVSDLGLLCLAVMLLVFVLRPVNEPPAWLKWLVGIAALLLLVQIVLSFIHTGYAGSGSFQSFANGQSFGQSGGGYGQSSGSTAQSF